MDYTLLASFFSLTALEIVLGIDNLIFIALIVDHLPEASKPKARTIGLMLALLFRIFMLFGIAWIIGLKAPWLQIQNLTFSGKDLLLLSGGVFLLYKATDGIHNEVTRDHVDEYKRLTSGFIKTILQIVLIDIVFSFDSIMTAIGLTNNIMVIIAAMTLAMLVMLAASSAISDFIARYPTLKMLALSFVMLIGVLLVAEGFHYHVPKGYIYFAMVFSLSVEGLNIYRRYHHNKS